MDILGVFVVNTVKITEIASKNHHK